MGNALVGQYFLKGDGLTQFSMTFPRGGLAATFVLQALQRVGSTPPSLAVDVQHKNHDDTAFTTAASFSAITSIGVYTLDVTALKEEVRIAYTITATQVYEGFLLNLLAPSWRPYA